MDKKYKILIAIMLTVSILLLIGFIVWLCFFRRNNNDITNKVNKGELSQIHDSLLPVYDLYDYNGNIIKNTEHEVREQEILCDTIRTGDRVLQLGGNIGASCITASKINKLDKNDCVEPQSNLIPILERNIKKNNSNSNIINGIVTESCINKSLSSNDGDGGAYIDTNSSNKPSNVNCFSLYDIKPKNGYTYLFADCEGCFPDFIKEYGEELSKQPIHTIVYEQDQGHRSKNDSEDYSIVNNFMEQNKYNCK